VPHILTASAETAACMRQQELTAWWGAVVSSGARPADSSGERQLHLPLTPQQAQTERVTPM